MFYLNSFSWQSHIHAELSKPYGQRLKAFLTEKEKARTELLPPAISMFRAFELTPLWGVKCVIIGQDPYPRSPHATGLAFAVPHGLDKTKWPGSLKNISKALKVDLGVELTSPDLISWALDGVLLLNRILTVDSGKPLSHQNQGWEVFTDAMIKLLIDAGRPICWVLWGKVAQDGIMPLLEANRAFERGHEVITACHPSPQAANLGFVWHKPFSKINQFCYHHGYRQIAWGAKSGT